MRPPILLLGLSLGLLADEPAPATHSNGEGAEFSFHGVLRGSAAPNPETGPTTATADEWFLFANHCHSAKSHDSFTPISVLLSQAALHGASSIAVTDHRTLAQCSDPDFYPQLGVYPICGEEWGSEGHAGLLNLPPDADPMDGWPLAEMVAEATALGASVIANHPFFDGDPWPEGRVSPGINGIEVWNGPWWWRQKAAVPNQRAVGWWQDHLEEGRRIFAIGGSDVHYVGLNPLFPCNYVLAAGPEPDLIQAAVEAGRMGISVDEDGPRTFLWADIDGDAEYEIPMGTNVAITSPTRLRIRIAVKKGKGDRLYLYTREGIVHSRRVDTAVWELRISALVDENTRDFIRVELRAGRTNYMRSLTNPIYVNYDD